eukprot:13515787-Ditylum_brightwellii.AAC.1
MHKVHCAHAWAPSTVSTYKSKLLKLQAFQDRYRVVALEKLYLNAPHCNPAILLMWAMQGYALSLPPVSMQKEHLYFNTVCSICSAAAFYYESYLTLKHHHTALCDTHSNHPRFSVRRPPTDHLAFTQMVT